MNEFIFPLRIYIEDVDFGGVVYHANYLKFFERARSEWAEQSGLGIEWQKQHGIFFVVRFAKIDYLKPARLHEQVEVVSRCGEKGYASLIFEQELRQREDETLIYCRAQIKIVSVDASIHPCAMPELNLI